MIPRPNASTITDDQLDALYEGLDLLEHLHWAHGDCLTLQIIQKTRQRSAEPKEGA